MQGFFQSFTDKIDKITGINDYRDEEAPPAFENTPEGVLNRLKWGNEKYIEAYINTAYIAKEFRKETAKNGQKPCAVILTCSDSRVPPEHIFYAGIGELFVIRTAGNVAGGFELGSVEYGAAHLKAKVIVVMGHSGCGAVAAALDGGFEGHLSAIADEIREGITGADNTGDAENLNIRHTAGKLYDESPIIKDLVDAGDIIIVQAKYDIKTGKVDFFN